jgi:hypothetical protein
VKVMFRFVSFLVNCGKKKKKNVGSIKGIPSPSELSFVACDADTDWLSLLWSVCKGQLDVRVGRVVNALRSYFGIFFYFLLYFFFHSFRIVVVVSERMTTDGHLGEKMQIVLSYYRISNFKQNRKFENVRSFVSRFRQTRGFFFFMFLSFFMLFYVFFFFFF